MAASPMHMTGTAEATVLQMSEQMEALAAAGDWDEIENLAIRLRIEIMNVPESDRRSVLLLLQQSTEKLVSQAKHARRNVSDKMSELRRGQKAKKAYERGNL